MKTTWKIAEEIKEAMNYNHGSIFEETYFEYDILNVDDEDEENPELYIIISGNIEHPMSGYMDSYNTAIDLKECADKFYPLPVSTVGIHYVLTSERPVAIVDEPYKPIHNCPFPTSRRAVEYHMRYTLFIHLVLQVRLYISVYAFVHSPI